MKISSADLEGRDIDPFRFIRELMGRRGGPMVLLSYYSFVGGEGTLLIS